MHRERVFDTLDEAVALEHAGIERTHAQAIVKTIDKGRSRLATREDILTLTAQLSALDAHMGIIRWAIGLGFAATLSLHVLVLVILL